ncbi:MAG: transposase, partial [Pyrinomonadaceae bacterium]
SNSRIVKLEEGRVTFKYKDSSSDQVKLSTVSAEEFIRRFLQHVLPERFVKVRYYGLLSPGNRHLLERARSLLETSQQHCRDSKQTGFIEVRPEPMRCPRCGSELILAGTFKARGREPP